MTYLFDTNVLSQEMARKPHVGTLRFLEKVHAESSCISVVTLAEVRSGITWLRLKGQRLEHADRVEVWLTRTLPRRYGERILTVSTEIADEAGCMLAAEKFAGRTAQWPDLLVAATAKMLGLTVVTLNHKHFDPLDVEIISL